MKKPKTYPSWSFGKRIYLVLVLVTHFYSIGWSQEAKTISASFQQIALTEALQNLETRYHLIFSYDAQLLAERRVTVSFQNLPLEKALDLILSDPDLTFKLVDEKYVIIRLKEGVDVDNLMDENRICGQVLDAFSRQGLEFASVFFPAQNKGLSAGKSGFFKMPLPENASGMIEISFVGYQKQQLSLSVFENGQCPEIFLRPLEEELTGVIVTDENLRGFSHKQKEPVQTIRPAKLFGLAGQTVPDVLRLVQLLPGVSSTGESTGGLQVRGGRPDQNLILFDGISVFHEGHFFGLVSPFNSEVVEKVEVHKRGFSPSFGGRLSSVIDIRSKETIIPRPEMTLGLNFLYGQAQVEIPLIKEKLSILVAARHSTSGVTNSFTNKKLFGQIFQEGRIYEGQQNAEGKDTLAPQYYFDDVNFKLNWLPNKKNKISISGLRMSDRLEYLSNTTDIKSSSDSLSLLNTGLHASWKHYWSTVWSSQVRVGYSFYDFRYLYIDDRSRQQIDQFNRQWNQLEESQVALETHYRQGDRHTLHFGYQYFQYQFLRKDQNFYSFQTDRYFSEEGQANLHSLFGNYHFSLADLLQLSLGLRYNYYKSTSQHLIEPRFRANLQLNPHWQIEMNAGQYYQFVGQLVGGNELSGEKYNWIVAQSASNAGIEPPVMQGEHFSISAFWKRDGLEVSLEAFQKKMSGLSSFAIRFGEYVNAYNLGEGQSKGFELLLQKQWRSWQFLGSYTLSQTQYSFLYWDDGRPFPASHDQRHLGHLLANWSAGHWEAGLRWSIGSGRAYTQAEGLWLPPGAVDSSSQVIIYGPQNAERLPIYHRLDGSLYFHIPGKTDKRWKMSLGLSALNIYNRSNFNDRRSVHAYRWDGTRVQVSIREITKRGLPFTPNISWRIHFY